MTEDKPNALDMLKLDPDAFMLEVSRVVSPQPRLHNWTIVPQQEGLFQCTECNATYSLGPKLNAWMIVHKVTYGESVRVLNETEFGCPIPPLLTESPEWWARELRDRVTQLEKELMPPEPRMFNAAARVLCGKTTVEDGEESVVWSDFYYATPYEQIAVALVALGHWQIGENHINVPTEDKSDD